MNFIVLFSFFLTRLSQYHDQVANMKNKEICTSCRSLKVETLMSMLKATFAQLHIRAMHHKQSAEIDFQGISLYIFFLTPLVFLVSFFHFFFHEHTNFLAEMKPMMHCFNCFLFPSSWFSHIVSHFVYFNEVCW